MDEKFDKILLFSGGIDSFIAYHFLGKPRTVYFDVQSRYTERELKVVKKLIPETIIDTSLNFSEREVGPNAYIPFRNLLLAAQAAKYSDIIYIVGIKGDNVSDKTIGIFAEFSQMLSKLEGRSIHVRSPFWENTKEDIIKWYLLNKLNEDNLLNTISCYSPDEETNYCGACPSCFRKWVAFWNNGIELEFKDTLLMGAYFDKAMAGHYDPKRNASIIKACGDFAKTFHILKMKAVKERLK